MPKFKTVVVHHDKRSFCTTEANISSGTIMARCQVTLLNGIMSLNNKAINLEYLSFPFSKYFPTWKTSLKYSLINLTVKREIKQIKTTHNSGIEKSGEKEMGDGGWGGGQTAAIKQENFLSIT